MFNLRKIRGENEVTAIPRIALEKKRSKEWHGGRWLIIILFLLTFVPSAFFYVKSKIPYLTKKLQTSWSETSYKYEENKGKAGRQGVIESIEKITSGRQGKYGVYVYELIGRQSYGVLQNEVFPAASLVKLPLMLAVYHEVEVGNLNLETTYRGYSYRQMLEMMGQFSNNDAFVIMSKIVGNGKIKEMIDRAGLKQTSFVQWESTPEDMGSLFVQLSEGVLINRDNREEFLKSLTKTEFENWIPAGVPADVRVAHKIGKDLVVYADAGIVYAPKPYVLVIMSVDEDETEANEVLPMISKAVWDFELQR